MKQLTPDCCSRAVSLYNDSIRRHEMPYFQLSEEGFSRLFLTVPSRECRIFAFYSDQEEGFALGVFDQGLSRFFITMIVVEPAMRRKGVGTGLIKALQADAERAFEEAGCGTSCLEISYFNPVNIRWNIPGGGSHAHQNAQGVLLGSGAHLFFKNLGFRDFSYQNTYYLDLNRYVLPEALLSSCEQKLAAASLSFTYFDPDLHKNMDELLKDLDNEIWSRQIPEELSREGGPRLFPVIEDTRHHVRGFAGPIVVEPDGRCWFLGVAVSSLCRRTGAATVLFNRMVQCFKEAGAAYLTLFTGEQNPARRIYERAGMKIVCSFACMRRYPEDAPAGRFS